LQFVFQLIDCLCIKFICFSIKLKVFYRKVFKKQNPKKTYKKSLFNDNSKFYNTLEM